MAWRYQKSGNANQDRTAVPGERREARQDHEASTQNHGHRQSAIASQRGLFTVQGQVLEVAIAKHVAHPGLRPVGRKQAGGNIAASGLRSVCPYPQKTAEAMETQAMRAEGSQTNRTMQPKFNSAVAKRFLYLQPALT